MFEVVKVLVFTIMMITASYLFFKAGEQNGYRLGFNKAACIAFPDSEAFCR